MKEFTDALNDTYQPKAVIVAYETRGGKYYLESRKVDEKGNLCEGKPVSRKLIDGMVKTFSTTFADTPHGAMPSTLLYVDDRPGHKVYVWYNPPQERAMTFVKSLSIKDGTYNVPGIVYVVRGQALYVYAFAGKKPSEKRPLVKYPMFNVYDDCRVCLGSARATKPSNYTWSALMKYWETLFWGSTNSHLIGSNPVKGNLVLALKESQDQPFDSKKWLPKGHIKLKDLMK